MPQCVGKTTKPSDMKTKQYVNACAKINEIKQKQSY